MKPKFMPVYTKQLNLGYFLTKDLIYASKPVKCEILWRFGRAALETLSNS